MNITLQDKLTAPEQRAVRQLYHRAFPPEERPPFFLLNRRLRQGRATLLAAKDGDAFVGFAYLVCRDDLVYLFFLAIQGGKRGCGYGSAVLQALRERYRGCQLFLARETLEEEAENYEERVRRRDFYLRGGFVDLPLSIREGKVVYDVMGIGGPVRPEDYDEMMRRWCGPVFRHAFPMRMQEQSLPESGKKLEDSPNSGG